MASSTSTSTSTSSIPITLASSDLLSILATTTALARKAGAVILEGSDALHYAPADDANAVDEKKNSVDLVTAYDVRVEQLLLGELEKMYPGFGFIGEESYAAGKRDPLTDTPTFCVDPIDGTTNFVHGFPFVCVSIGLIYKKTPVVGVIYNPFLDEMYSAVTGHGATLVRRGKTIKLPIGVRRPFRSLGEGLLAVEWGSDRTLPIARKKADSFMRLAGDPNPKGGPELAVPGGRMAHSLRSVGSAALNFCLVATGALDTYWEIGCWPWDVCAASVIATEAGCLVSGDLNSSNHRDDGHDGVVREEVLVGRKYVVVRAVADTEGESGREAQRRIIKEFYETVEDWTPN